MNIQSSDWSCGAAHSLAAAASSCKAATGRLVVRLASRVAMVTNVYHRKAGGLQQRFEDIFKSSGHRPPCRKLIGRTA